MHYTAYVNGHGIKCKYCGRVSEALVCDECVQDMDRGVNLAKWVESELCDCCELPKRLSTLELVYERTSVFGPHIITIVLRLCKPCLQGTKRMDKEYIDQLPAMRAVKGLVAKCVKSR